MFRSVFAFFSLAAVTGCSGPTTTTTADLNAPADRRDTLVIAYQSDIGNLIPMVSETAADSAIASNIYMPLIDSEFDCSLKKKPGLVTSWEWSDDGKVLSMELRDDITFADGKRVTAEDIAFTYELIADPKVASPRISYVQRMKEDGRPKVIDETHIEWHFTEAYDRDTQTAHASMSVVPKHILKDADRGTLRGHDFGKAPLASGPWRLAKYDPNNRIVLEPNRKFTGPEDMRPKLNRVIFRILPEYSTRLIELESGNVDLMESVLVADADKLRKNSPHIKLVRRGYRAMDYVAWNKKNPLFEDKSVRQALTMAMDIDTMIGKLLTSETGEKYAKRAVGTITPELCGVHNDDILPFPYDVSKSKELLAKAGWTDTNGDGILDKDGKPFEFTLSTNTGNDRRNASQILIQAYLKAVGVRANLEKLESNTFFENMRKKNYDAAMGGWAAGLFIDPSTIWHSDTEDKKYEFNFVSYSNPKADDLMERGMTIPNPAEAAPIWKEMQAVIYDDQPYTFLWWMDEIVAIDSRFEDTSINVLSSLNNLHEWNVPADKVKYPR